MTELAALLMLGLLSAVFPVLRLPAPTGPYRVGTRVLSPDDRTPSAVQLWYPAAPAARGPLAAWLPAMSGIRNRIFRRVRTASVRDAAVSPSGGRFPVLIYVNCWGGTRGENTALMQELASQGFVVAAGDQPGGMVDGIDLSAAAMDFSSDAAEAKTMLAIAVRLRVQASAASLLLDRLTALDTDPDSPFTHRLDTERAGILGFSFGGATAAEAAILDTRFRAALNMDGLTFGEAARRGPRFPYLLMSDGSPVPTDADIQAADPGARNMLRAQKEDTARVRRDLARDGGYLLTLAGSRHANFSDYPMLVPWRRINGAGAINPWRAGAIVRRWTAVFFRSALLDGTLPDVTPDPEVRFEYWPPPRLDEIGHARPVAARR